MPLILKRARASALGAYRQAKRVKLSPDHYAMAANVIWSGYKRYRKYRRRRSTLNSRVHVGPRPGISNSKRRTESFSGATANSRVFYWNKLFDIPKGTSTTERERNLVNWRGTKICLEYNNWNDAPMILNFAVVVPKFQGAPNTTNLLRAVDGQRGQNLDFTTLDSLGTTCPAINADIYTVLMHKRFKMNGTTASFRVGNLKTWGYFEKYIKMNRQIRYDDTTDTLAAQQPYIILWFERFLAATGAPAGTNDVAFNTRSVTYFKDP